MSNYFSDSRISRSDIVEFLKSPAHWKQFKDDFGKVPSKAMDIGTIYHLALLEPEKLEDQSLCLVLTEEHKVEPDKTWTSKANKQHLETLKADSEIVLNQDDYDKILHMRDAAYQSQPVKELLQHKELEPEKERYWKAFGIGCKCKIDGCTPDFNFDLKSAASARPFDFQRAIRNYQLYLQAGMYTEGDTIADGYDVDYNSPKPFAFIAQEKEPPFACSVNWMSADYIVKGMEKYREVLMDMARCKEVNTYPGYEFWSMREDQSFVASSPNFEL